MRIKVLFSTSKLPILYRHRFLTIIKEALKRSDPDYKKQLYPDKNAEISKKAKPFSFSISLPMNRQQKKELFIIDKGTEIKDTVFHFTENGYLSFYISSCDYQFMINLYNGLLEMKEFDFSDDIKLKLERVFLLNEKKIAGDEVTFKTNSPVLIEDGHEKPILPIDDLKSFNYHF